MTNNVMIKFFFFIHSINYLKLFVLCFIFNYTLINPIQHEGHAIFYGAKNQNNKAGTLQST